MPETCHLCEHTVPQLRDSHIIPNFVVAWLKDTSPGHIRDMQTPNKRIQDFETMPLLCDRCEQRFAVHEKRFAEQAFVPFHESGGALVSIPYGPWALKCTTSISWRVLTYHKQKGHLGHLSDEQRALAERALTRWRDFLLDRCEHPGEHEQHLFPFDLVESTGRALSPYFNRYTLRSIDMDVVADELGTQAHVYSKMCRFLLIGFIHEPRPTRWRGTMIHVRRGLMGGRRYMVPDWLPDHMSTRATMSARALSTLSPKQTAKIKEVFRTRPEEIARSEVAKAMEHDIRLSGRKAFTITRPTPDDEKSS